MKSTKIFMLSAALAVIAFVGSAFVKSNMMVKKNALAGNGFAVIELFTSEGCSSCPPADELVARIQKEYKDQPVYILAYHVDYWNRLGWKDVFSSADYSKRQSTYAKYLKLPSVYTPQIVVNGRKEFVGSEDGTLRNAIKAGLQTAAPAQLSLSAIEADGTQLKVRYQAQGNGNNSQLLLALVEKNAQTKVRSGENGGRTLSHVQIVQKLQSIALANSKSSVESIALPTGFNAQNWEVIGLLQNTSTGEITGAAKVAVTAAS